MRTILILMLLAARVACAQNWQFASSPAAAAPAGLTFDQLAASNSFAIYDLTKMGYSVGQANINLTDSSGNSHTLTLGNNGPYATNNSSVPELNSTNFWTYNNGTVNSTRWSGAISTVTQPVTIYVLLRLQTFSSTRYFWDGNESLRIQSGPGLTMAAGTDNGFGSLSTGSWMWLEVHYNGSSSFVKLNDSTFPIASGNAGANSLISLEIGDDNVHNFFNQFDLAYISFHNANMSSGFATQFYTAAKARFGSQLP